MLFKRGKCVNELFDSENYHILQMLVIGNYLLVLCSDNILRIWDHKTGGFCFLIKEIYNKLIFSKEFIATTFIHPSTYLNKIVIGSACGKLQLWNFVSM